MVTPTPSRASSRSPRRNQNNSPSRSSPRPSPQSTPKRTPLLERSDSQKNSIYRQTPFPTLPSQVFAPKGDLYIFGEGQPSSRTAPAIPPKSPTRLSHSSGSLTTSPVDRPPLPDVPPLFSPVPSPQASTVDSPDPLQRSHVRRRTASSASKSIENASPGGASTGIDTGESSQMASQRAAVVPRWPLPSSSTESFAARSRRQKSSSDHSQGSLLPHRSVERLRSQPSSGSVAKPRKRAQTGHFEPPKSPEDRPRSSSSPSTPTDAFIQALINSGTNVQYPKLRKPSATSLRSESTTVNAAYPPPLRLQRKRANSQLAKAAAIPSQSLEPLHSGSDSSARVTGVRAAPSQSSFMTYASDGSTNYDGSYPHYTSTGGHWDDELGDTVTELHPRNLKRQRSDYLEKSESRSAKTSRESLRSSVGSFYHFLNDSRTAWAQVYYRGDGKLRLETPPGVENVNPQLTPDNRQYGGPPGVGHSPGSGGFPDRIYVPRVRPLIRNAAMNDQTNDQSPSGIRMVPQDSSSPYNRTETETDSSIIPPSRPWAQRSSSTPGSGSDTLSRMRTFWQSSSSPYNTTETDSSRRQRRQFSMQDYSSTVAETDERSSSVSRARPMIFDSSFCPLTMTGDSSRSGPPRQPHQNGYSFADSENGDTIDAAPSVIERHDAPLGSPIFNPTPEVPHLSPSKRHGPGLPYWRTPSFDEGTSPFDRANFQLVLFCVGFLMPPAWWVAAFYPLPPRPQWERGSTYNRVHKEQSIDLFDSLEVYRYQKAHWWRTVNRFMAIVGIVIIAAVIACVVVATT